MPDPQKMKAYGLQVRRHREKLHLTQTALAAQIGTSVKNLNNIERGLNYPGMEVYWAICAALHLPKSPLKP